MNVPSPICHFPRSIRLLSKRDYQRVFKDPVRSSDGLFTLLAVKNEQNSGRLGLAIAKKTIAKAVHRNHIKRLVRESFRHHQHSLQGIDIVVLAKKGLQDRNNSEIQHSLTKHWERLVKRCAES